MTYDLKQKIKQSSTLLYKYIDLHPRVDEKLRPNVAVFSCPVAKTNMDMIELDHANTNNLVKFNFHLHYDY